MQRFLPYLVIFAVAGGLIGKSAWAVTHRPVPGPCEETPELRWSLYWEHGRIRNCIAN
ncbi:MAG TPA: hypothetical protein VF533_06110 [Solirubrobacteraceae bacterium]|jgi:hypothetical protein